MQHGNNIHLFDLFSLFVFFPLQWNTLFYLVCKGVCFCVRSILSDMTSPLYKAEAQ